MKTIFPLLIILLTVSCQQSFDDRAAADAEQYTRKKCPAMVNENTRIDSLIFYRNTHTLHYYYTLTGNADDPEAVKASQPKQILLDGIRNNTALKDYKEHHYSFAYTYYSDKHHNKKLFEAIFTPKDYR